MTRRRAVVAATLPVGCALLARSLRAEPGSRAFYVGTAAVAAAWTGGALASGPVPIRPSKGVTAASVAGPVATGAAAFGAFYAAARLSRRVPPLERAVARVLALADEGQGTAVLMTTLANGAAEELFFRGAVVAALGEAPAWRTTAVYAAATAATGNPALVLAAGVMGTVFDRVRARSGGVGAPILTHLTWSTLMVRGLPRVVRLRTDAGPA